MITGTPFIYQWIIWLADHFLIWLHVNNWEKGTQSERHLKFNEEVFDYLKYTMFTETRWCWCKLVLIINTDCTTNINTRYVSCDNDTDYISWHLWFWERSQQGQPLHIWKDFLERAHLHKLDWRWQQEQFSSHWATCNTIHTQNCSLTENWDVCRRKRVRAKLTDPSIHMIVLTGPDSQRYPLRDSTSETPPHEAQLLFTSPRGVTQ